jgi:hypothetical protein
MFEITLLIYQITSAYLIILRNIGIKMSIIFSKEFIPILENEIEKTKNEIHIISAFCKENVVDFIEKRLNKNVKTKKLLVRFTLDDILTKVTDFSLYNYCKNNKWDMFIQFNLHAKTYIFDKKRCIIGSANLTNRGTGISTYSNIEISSLDNIEESDMVKIDNLFDRSIKMTDKIYELMIENVNSIQDDEIDRIITWNNKILSFFDETIVALFPFELPLKEYHENIDNTSTDFIDIGNINDKELIKELFRSCKAYNWIKQVLQTQEAHEIYFGNLTAKLHEIMVAEPPAYRKDVKTLLANLLTWIENLASDEIVIDRPNHSERIRLR